MTPALHTARVEWIVCSDCDGHGSFRVSHSGSYYYGAPDERDCESCDGQGGYEAELQARIVSDLAFTRELQDKRAA